METNQFVYFGNEQKQVSKSLKHVTSYAFQGLTMAWLTASFVQWLREGVCFPEAELHCGCLRSRYATRAPRHLQPPYLICSLYRNRPVLLHNCSFVYYNIYDYISAEVKDIFGQAFINLIIKSHTAHLKMLRVEKFISCFVENGFLRPEMGLTSPKGWIYGFDVGFLAS